MSRTRSASMTQALADRDARNYSDYHKRPRPDWLSPPPPPSETPSQNLPEYAEAIDPAGNRYRIRVEYAYWHANENGRSIPRRARKALKKGWRWADAEATS